MKKAELIKKYEQTKKILEKRIDRLYKRFKKISNVPIEKADFEQEEKLSNKMWWLQNRIENIENKITRLEETLPYKIKRNSNKIIDSIITNFIGVR